MVRRIDKFEKSSIKVIISILLGFGVGFLITKDWVKAVEALSIGGLMSMIYLLGTRINEYTKDEDDEL